MTLATTNPIRTRWRIGPRRAAPTTAPKAAPTTTLLPLIGARLERSAARDVEWTTALSDARARARGGPAMVCNQYPYAEPPPVDELGALARGAEVIPAPVGESTYQRAPNWFSPCPVVWPGLWSPTK